MNCFHKTGFFSVFFVILVLSAGFLLFTMFENLPDVGSPCVKHPALTPYFWKFIAQKWHTLSQGTRHIPVKTPTNSEKNWLRLRKELVKFRRISKKYDFDLFLAAEARLFSWKGNNPDRDFGKNFLDICSDLNMQCIDLTPCYTDEDKNKYLIYPIDSHSNALASKIRVTAIYRALTSRNLLRRN